MRQRRLRRMEPAVAVDAHTHPPRHKPWWRALRRAPARLVGQAAAEPHRLLSVVTGLVAVLDLASALRVGFRPQLTWLVEAYPIGIASGQSRLLAAFSSFLLLQLAVGLWRRKRLALLLSSLLLAFSALHHGLALREALEASISGALLLALIVRSRDFRARSDPPSVRQGLRLLAAALAFTLLYGTLGSLWLDRRAGLAFDPLGALTQILNLFLAFPASSSLLRSFAGREFAASIQVIGLLTLSWALLLLLRPVVQRPRRDGADQLDARALAAEHGRTTLAAIGPMGGRPLLFSPSRRSVLAYGVRGRGALALGDPVGPPEEQAAMIAAFRALCERNDWQPGFYQVRPEGLDLYRAAGFEALLIGDEAVVNLERFSLKGAAGSALRPPRNKLLRLGWRVELCPAPQPLERLEALRPISEAWLAGMGRREDRGEGESGGARPAHHHLAGEKRPADCSITSATWKRVSSSKGRPMSWRPSGRPLASRPAGTVMPGRPAMFTVTVKMSFRYISTGSPPDISPMPKADDGVAGVSTASTPAWKATSKSRLIRVRTFCALT